MVNCCNHNKNDKICIRKGDKKSFKLPRKFSRRKCKKAKGFTMRSSCAPYKDCSKKKLKGGKWSEKSDALETTYLAGGCFWGIQEFFDNYNGVIKTRVGYMGGKESYPTYEEVCNNNTNHAETVEIIYDPIRVSYLDILKAFDKIRNKKVSKSQYRSVIFATSEQIHEALEFIKDKPDIKLLSKQDYTFYEAENYHQNYNSKLNIGGGKTKKNKKRFLYNPNDPKKSFDVYIDKNPNDTIPIKYTTLNDVKNTIKKLESLYKNNKYTHKRIWQVGMILYVRLKVLKDKKPKEFKLSERYFKHLGKRSKIKNRDKDIQTKQRKKYTFKI
jgi:methionine-S-sulfoxide reductase